MLNQFTVIGRSANGITAEQNGIERKALRAAMQL
jgi:hypothetical protein